MSAMSAWSRSWPLSSWLLSSVVLSLATGVSATGWAGFGGLLGGAAGAALVLAAVVLAVRSVAGLSSPRDGHRIPGRTLRAQTIRVGVTRLRDPDAAGRPRPRAPGTAFLAI